MKRYRLFLLLVALSTEIACETPRSLDSFRKNQELVSTNSGAIRVGDLPPRLQMELYTIERERHDKITEVVRKYLLSAKVETPGGAGLTSQEGAVSDEDLQNLYNENKLLIPYSYEDVKPDLKKLYLEGKEKSQRLTKVREIVKSDGVILAFLEPQPPHFEIPTEGFPSIGADPKTAKHTIVQFVDYTCPYCRLGERDLQNVLAAHKDIALIAIDAPIHGFASELEAKGAFCANRVDKYQGFRKALLTPAPSPIESPYNDGRIRTLGLDRAKWVACLSSKEASAYLERSLKLAKTFGVQNTPKFFLDGLLMDSLESLKETLSDSSFSATH